MEVLSLIHQVEPSPSQLPGYSSTLTQREWQCRVVIEYLNNTSWEFHVSSRLTIRELKQMLGNTEASFRPLRNMVLWTSGGSRMQDDEFVADWASQNEDLVLQLRLVSYETYAQRIMQFVNPRLHLVYNFISLFVGIAFLAACSHLSFFLPFDSAVPVTMQTFGVQLIGALYGAFWGVWTVVGYLAIGVFFHLPFFALHSNAGPDPLGPTGGYLLGFVLSAFITGRLSERGFDRRFRTACMAMLLGDISVYLLGLPWLAQYMGWNLQLFQNGLFPFIPGDLVKIALSAALLPLGWKLMAWKRRRTDNAAV